jgi:4-amino-4-deoxy-L-arabinose transferase-like glycosyltransferase
LAAALLIIAVIWTALLSATPTHGRELAGAAAISSAAFLVSLPHLVITIGFPEAVADQFFLLLISVGLWIAWVLFVIGRFIRRLADRILASKSERNLTVA